MAEAPLNINVKAIFTGKKAFKEAETATGKLAKGAGKLAGALGLAFSTRAVINYSKAAMMAAAQDQEAQAILSQNLKNLGLNYANVDAEGFIATLERQTAILDDELRPAYAKLARVTGSIGKTQKIMKAAFDAAKGSGQSYSTVIETLSQAYVGNTKGLRKLNTGLTTAEISAMSFDEILQVITEHFKGAGAIALDGYAGKMAKLNTASKNSAETIGGALLDSFSHLAGGGDIDKATSKIDTFSKGLADMIRYMTGAKNVADAFAGVDFDFLGTPHNRKSYGGATGAAGAMASQNRAKLARAQELKILKDKNAASLLEAKLKKDQATLDEAKKKFDLERIGIQEALANATDEETRARLKLMLAILDDNAAGVKKAGDNLSAVQDKVAASLLGLGNSSILAAGNLIAASMQVRDAANNPYASVSNQVGVVTTNAFATASTNVGGGADALFDQRMAALLAALAAATAAANGTLKVEVKTDLPSLVTVVNNATVENNLRGNRSTGAGSLVAM